MFRYPLSVIIFVFLFFNVNKSFSQSKIFEGTICYSIELDSTLQGLISPEIASIEITAKNKKYSVNIFGSNVQIFEDGLDSTVLVTFRNFMDGNRYCIKIHDENQDISPYTVTNEVKNILGYSARKVIFFAETNEVLETWITNDIDININQYLNPGLEGFPLEFYLHYHGKYLPVKIQRICREYIDDSIFDIPLDCFFATPDELQELLNEE